MSKLVFCGRCQYLLEDGLNDRCTHKSFLETKEIVTYKRISTETAYPLCRDINKENSCTNMEKKIKDISFLKSIQNYIQAFLDGFGG